MNFSLADYTWPSYGDRRPFEHQQVTVQFLLRNKRAFVLNEMGTGKTLSAIWACDILLTADKIRKVLIVGPLSTIKSVWLKELAMNVPTRKASIAHGVRQVRAAAISAPVQFVIINHDGVKVMEEELIREQFDIVIIDELTAFKSYNAERSKAMKRVADAQTVKYNPKRTRDGAVWGMTGEITPNAPTEAFFQCKIVNPFNKWLPRYFGQFRDACMYEASEMIWVAKPEAPQVVAMCAQPAIRYTRDQCLDLPDTLYQIMDVPLSKEQDEWYNRMRKDCMVQYEGGEVTAANAAVLLNKLLQISAGAVKTADGSVIEIGCNERISMLMDIYNGTPQKKLVVFATYRATIDMLMKKFNAMENVTAAAIHGDVTQSQRASIIENFQTGNLNIIVLQPQSSAHGITLTAASTIVWFSLIASGELYQQGNARIIRAGQTRKTQIIQFVSTKAERHLSQILEKKGNLSKEILELFRAGIF